MRGKRIVLHSLSVSVLALSLAACANTPQSTQASDQPKAESPGILSSLLNSTKPVTLPAGTEIVKGTPSWVHFGTGATEIDVQLEPGTHKLTLQLGDDLHRTIDGFCQTITVNVEK